MQKQFCLKDFVNPTEFLVQLRNTSTSNDVDVLLAQLPIASDVDYDSGSIGSIWRPGMLHWVPVGLERGNAGRIKLANNPINPLAERLINGMEAIIELYRQRELAANPGSLPPSSPRDATLRYFDLPSLDTLPRSLKSIRGQKPKEYARQLARALRLRLLCHKGARRFAVLVEDDGIGQPPERMHETLLSLGATTKADKPYLIGVFGQGGSSTYAASESSWVISRRAPDLLGGSSGGVGWTVIRHIFPKGRRDDYFAYLAASPEGHVPSIDEATANKVGIKHGTSFAHLNYDFGRGGSAISRNLYQALNHVIFNPILPYELYALKETADPMYGTAYRLANLTPEKVKLDKRFGAQLVSLSN